ncbi:MAG TPA: ATP-binding protein [Saprospiraceae bacterium]|nr:ATP-binding protein [Saprospiraceae bacterium]HMQ84249.1 ATP-binding protein [Saprospiraceae bacterium]
MVKNPTPQQVSLIIALSFSVSGLIISSLLALFFSGYFFHPLYLILQTVLFFGIAYAVTVYYLREYIYRKIKVIYKTIHRHKIAPQEKGKMLNLKSNIIDDVEKEVAEWAVRQDEEIEKYKAWAEYRRNFVGDISHELKTPIFNIEGYLHTLLDGALYDEKVNTKFLRKAAKNLARLNTIVEDLEAISNLESGKLVLELQVFDIKLLVEEVFEDLEMKASERAIHLGFKTDADENYKVRADRESIRQVLTNLINNSIKYGIDNGRTRVGFYDMDKHILIEVADNGIGIPKKHINHVFDRFYRVDKSRSRARGGSGLGLSIVKHIIEAHKQTINVRSTPNLGSTFGFTLEKV